MMHARSVRMRRWSRWEYEQLVERGFFRPDERLELLDGLMLVKEPQSSAHMTAIRLVEDALRMAFETRWDVRTQGPIALDPRARAGGGCQPACRSRRARCRGRPPAVGH